MIANEHDHPLSQSEKEKVWKRLEERWGAGRNYWYPLNGTTLPPDVVAFGEKQFNEHIHLEVLHHILKAHGVTTIWEMREGGAVYEMICELLDPCYDGEEGYWTSNDMDWLLYASHEHSLAVAGTWLVPEIQAVWPQWQEHVWRS